MKVNPNTIYVGAKAAQAIITVFRDIFPFAIEVRPGSPSRVSDPADDDRYRSAEFLLLDVLSALGEAGVLRTKLEYEDGNDQHKLFELNKQGITRCQRAIREYKAVRILMNGAAIVASAVNAKAFTKFKATTKK